MIVTDKVIKQTTPVIGKVYSSLECALDPYVLYMLLRMSQQCRRELIVTATDTLLLKQPHCRYYVLCYHMRLFLHLIRRVTTNLITINIS
jgi:hypothetical protein